MRNPATVNTRAPTRRKAIYAVLAMIFAAGASITPAVAQEPGVSQLASRDQVVKILGTRYGETPVARGLTETGSMVEVFAAADGDTWTIVMTNPQGVSRVASTGVAWTDIRPPIGELSSYAQTN